MPKPNTQANDTGGFPLPQITPTNFETHDLAIPTGLSHETLEQFQEKFGRDIKVGAAPSATSIPKPRPLFQMPFMYNQKWLATTYDGPLSGPGQH
jgi:hypothetical protein